MSDGERRTGSRKLLPRTAMLAHASGHRLCKVFDISVSGAMLDIGWGVLTHDVPVELMIDLPNGANAKAYSLHARVARVSRDGTAIKFASLDHESESALASLLRSG